MGTSSASTRDWRRRFPKRAPADGNGLVASDRGSRSRGTTQPSPSARTSQAASAARSRVAPSASRSRPTRWAIHERPGQGPMRAPAGRPDVDGKRSHRIARSLSGSAYSPRHGDRATAARFLGDDTRLARRRPRPRLPAGLWLGLRRGARAQRSRRRVGHGSRGRPVVGAWPARSGGVAAPSASGCSLAPSTPARGGLSRVRRTSLAAWPGSGCRLAAATTVLFVVQENLEHQHIGQALPGLSVLGSAEYPDAALVIGAIALAVASVVALFRWRRDVLVARIRSVRRLPTRAPRSAPAPPGRLGRAPARLDRRPPVLRASPAAGSARPSAARPPDRHRSIPWSGRSRAAALQLWSRCVAIVPVGG